ncbi:sugar-binding domain-containing protein [Pseudobacter ginsenosidimutans]|nr:sugar-binding domain-containing protein [Pseudobacter ginsenosidimutans]
MKRFFYVLALGALQPFYAMSQQGWAMQPGSITTRWAKQVQPAKVLPEYPRPQMVRPSWTNLNGLWQYSITSLEASVPATWKDQILVPFPIESALSGVKKPLQAHQALWYRRQFNSTAAGGKQRTLLHFGAVDYDARVFVNGKELGRHTGGYQAFSIDITDALKPGANELIVRVWDPTDLGPNPHGKQVLAPQGIMYTPSSGIWQTVWMETLPAQYIASLKTKPDIDKEVLDLDVSVVGNCDGCQVEAIVLSSGKTVTKATDKNGQPLQLRIPGARRWSPDDPFLYDLTISLTKNGKVIDHIRSYFGMRKISVQQDAAGRPRIFLNNRYYYNLGTLDQGFWPDGLYTAPTDEALKFDILAAKAMGFNTIRKHIKLEPARWYYHCDQAGMLVWQDMVNPGNDSPEARAQFEKECAENIAQLYNYPSITTWVLFNEKWGQYDQARLTNWLKALDPTRLINGHSGEKLYVNDQLRSPSPDAWIHADITDVHAYPNPGHIAFEKGKAAVLGEFGGIGVPIEGHLWNDLQAGWGYDGVVTPPLLRKQYGQMMDSLKLLENQGLSASIYTQPFDVESEQNGLITYDRAIIKLPVSVIREIHAKVWPATRNLAGITKGFAAIVADSVNKDYAARLKEYQSGKKDSAFLRALTLLAIKNKDSANLFQFSAEYIRQLKAPMIDHNIQFIETVTGNSTDPGYPLLMQWVKEYLKEGERNRITTKLQEIIFREQAKLQLGENPDWSKVEAIISNHKPLDGEFIRGLSVIYYLNAIGQDKPNAAKNLADAASIYDSLYHSGMYNEWAWALFGKTSDKRLLEKALVWAKKGIGLEKDPFKQANIMDTYANLLHKLGRTEEALVWQKKAVAASPGDGEIKENYEKMLKGEKTWHDGQ